MNNSNNQSKSIFGFLSTKQSRTSSQIKSPSPLLEAKELFSIMPFALPIRIYFIILAGSFILLSLTLRKLPPLAPLFYSLPWGDEQLVRSNQLFIIPFSMLVVFIINLLIILLLIKKDKFLTLVLLWSNCFFALMGIITLTKIIFLII